MAEAVIDLLSLFLMVPGPILLLIFLGALSMYLVLSMKTWLSGLVLSVSGLAYLSFGLWLLFWFSTETVQILSFVLIVFGIGLIGFGMDLFVVYRRKLKQKRLSSPLF